MKKSYVVVVNELGKEIRKTFYNSQNAKDYASTFTKIYNQENEVISPVIIASRYNG